MCPKTGKEEEDEKEEKKRKVNEAAAIYDNTNFDSNGSPVKS